MRYEERSSKRNIMFGSRVDSCSVLLDQYTKYLAVTNLKDKPAFVLWDKVFELTYLENRGAAFGLLQNRQLFFICIAVVIFVFILYCYIRIPKTGKYLPLRLCGIFIVAGAPEISLIGFGSDMWWIFSTSV